MFYDVNERRWKDMRKEKTFDDNRGHVHDDHNNKKRL